MVFCIKKWLLSVGLFVLVFCTLGLPFTKMNFFWDAYGTLLHAVQKGATGHFVKEVFINDISSEETILADNQRVVGSEQAPTMFSFVYRPFIYVYLYLQYLLFGYEPYPFFLGMVGLHALIVVFLFLLLCNFLSLSTSFLLAGFFAYNHAWWSLLRWIGVELYFIETFFLMLFLWCLYKTLTTNQFWWSVPAGLCLLHNLFLKEQSLALLPWLGMVFLAEQALVYNGVIFDWRWIKRFIQFSWPSWAAVVSWLLVRWCILQNLHNTAVAAPSNVVVASAGVSGLYKTVTQWLVDVPTIVVDIVGLNWFPPFHKIEKALLLAVFIGFFLWLLSAIKDKRWVLFFVASYLLFAWPTYTLRHYHPRYIYFAMLFFIGLVALALRELMNARSFTPGGASFDFAQDERGSQKPLFRASKYHVALAGLLIITLLNAGFLIKRMRVSERETDLVAQSFKTLVAENPKIFERTMCFYGLPPELFDATVAQAMAWLAPDYQRRTIYYFKYEKTLADCKLDEAFLATDPLFITWDAINQKMVIVPPAAV